MADTNPARELYPTLVQTAQVWPGDDYGWETQIYLRTVAANEGAGQLAGDAELEQDAGEVMLPNLGEVQRVGPAPTLNPDEPWGSLAGRWVRLLIADAAGSVNVAGATYLPFWHGAVSQPSYRPDGSEDSPGGRMTWGCIGLLGVLDQVAILGGWEWHNGNLVALEAMPVFNDLPGGDRSAAQHTVNGVSVYVHERGTPGTTWRARDVVELLLAGWAAPRLPGFAGAPSGLTWRLDPTSAALLEFPIDRLDLCGRTVGEALALLISPARGQTFRITVAGAVATITVYQTNPEAITVGATTLPAATPVSLTISGSLWMEAPAFTESTDYRDWITLYGARPWVSLTFWWTPGDSASSILPDGWTTSDTPGDKPEQEAIYRRFKLNPAWLGGQYNRPGIGLRNTLPYTETGTDGSRTFGGNPPAPAALELTRDLPWGQGFVDTEVGPRQAPLVIVGSGSTWLDVSSKVQVTPDRVGGGLILATDAKSALYLKNLIGSSRTLLVTLGVREWAPLTVAWRRQTGQPRDLPRVLTRRQPDCEQWLGLEGTVYGVDGAGALRVQSAHTTIRDDLPTLNATLAQLRARYGGSGGDLEWSERGRFDFGPTYAPARLVGPLTVGSRTITANAVITRRSWRFALADYGTSYRAERIPVDPQVRA